MRKLSVFFMVVVLLVAAIPSVPAQGNQITVANANQLTQVMRLGRGKPNDVAFSPDGSLIAVASSVGVWLYSANTLNTATEPPLLVGNDPVDAVTFTADGKMVIAAEEGTIRFWDIASQTENGAAVDIGSSTYFVAVSPDGSLVATNGSEWNTIDLIDIASRSVKATLSGHTSTIKDAAFSADGSQLVSGADDNSVRLWNVADGSEAATLSGHTSYVTSVNFSADSSVIVSSSQDQSAIVWDVAGQTALTTLKPADGSDYAYAAALSPDGSKVAVGYGYNKIRIWDATGAGEPVLIETNETGDIQDIEFSPAGDRLLTLGYAQSIQLWDAATGTLIAEALGHTDDMTSVAFRPDSSTLMIGSDNDKLYLWDTAARPELHASPTVADVLTILADNTTSIAFAPDGSVAATIEGFDAMLLDPKSGAVLGTLDGDGLSDSLAFSPDSTLIAYVGTEGVYVFDVAQRTRLAHLTDHNGWVTTIAFSPDQTMIATGAGDGTVRVWALPQ